MNAKLNVENFTNGKQDQDQKLLSHGGTANTAEDQKQNISLTEAQGRGGFSFSLLISQLLCASASLREIKNSGIITKQI